MKRIFLFCLLVFACACAPGRFVRPLQKGQLAVGADIGGPLFSYSGTTIPLPLTNLNVGYGLRQNTTVYAGMHTTALAFGLVQLDAGAVHAFRQPQQFIPGISGAASINFMVGTHNSQARLYPQADLNAFWEYGSSKNLIYTGISNWFETHSTRAHGETQPTHWLPSLQVGHTITRENWDYTLELKQVAFNEEKSGTVVDYKGISGNGATGVYFGIRRKF